MNNLPSGVMIIKERKVQFKNSEFDRLFYDTKIVEIERLPD